MFSSASSYRIPTPGLKTTVLIGLPAEMPVVQIQWNDCRTDAGCLFWYFFLLFSALFFFGLKPSQEKSGPGYEYFLQDHAKKRDLWGWKLSFTAGGGTSEKYQVFTRQLFPAQRGQPLKEHVHLVATHHNESRCHCLAGKNRERKLMRGRFTHWHTSESAHDVTATQQFWALCHFV